MNPNETAHADRELVITRIFNAPRELVFKAWTEPEHIARWWGPKGFTTKVTALDLRPGGAWRYIMTGPNGAEYPIKGVFREVIPSERIVTEDGFDEGYEQVVKGDLPPGMLTTVIFEDLNGKTKLTLRMAHASAEDRRKHEEMGVLAGWSSSFDRLEAHLGNRMTSKQ